MNYMNGFVQEQKKLEQMVAVVEEDTNCKGALLSLAFERIILDEAHDIR